MMMNTVCRYLPSTMKMAQLSGASGYSGPAGQLLAGNQILVMTHQVLLNALV